MHEHVTAVPERDVEHGFTIIEVIIAVLMIATVVSGAALAIAGGETHSTRSLVATRMAEVAQRSLEDADGNLQMREACDTQWDADTPPNYSKCVPAPQTVKDEQGRRYNVVIEILPVDDASDGQGLAAGGDADGQSRDYYDTAVRVAPIDTANLGSAKSDFDLRGRVDWNLADRGSVRLFACSHYRRDRTVDDGRCQPGSGLAGVSMQLVPVADPGNAAIAPGPIPATNSVGQIATGPLLHEGDYRIVVASPQVGHEFYRVSPEVLHVTNGSAIEATATMVPIPGTTQICGRIANPDNGYGWEVTGTNFAWSENRSLVWKGGFMGGLDSTMKCNWPITDPLAYDNARMFLAEYGIEVQQQNPDFRVTSATTDCTGALAAPDAAHPVPTHLPTDKGAPYLGVYQQQAGAHRICLEFYSTPIPVVVCAAGDPACTPICTANCGPPPPPPPPPPGGVPPGTVGPPTTRTASAYGGPNDSDKGGKCIWDPTKTGWKAGTGSAKWVPDSAWMGLAAVGGVSSSGATFADGTKYYCKKIVFATKNYDYPKGTCLQATWGGTTVRGIARDTIGASGRVDVTVGAFTALDPGTKWNAYQWGLRKTSFSVVKGDPVCEWSSSGGSTTTPPPPPPPAPVIVWMGPKEDPAIGNPSFASAGNEGTGVRES